MASPIADLTYRNYEGPHEPARLRWWAIAKTMMLIGFKRKGTWTISFLSAWYYFAIIFVLFIVGMMNAQLETAGGRVNMNPYQQYLEGIVWKDQLLHGISYGQLPYLLIALLIGAGTIANDTRANALQVYLSKPITKWDYLFGKWMGVFLPLLLLMAIPSLAFYFYGALTYHENGFISQDPWVFLKLLAIFPIMAAFHASLILGFSSMFNSGRVAGTVYAGLYFITNFFTILMGINISVMANKGGAPAALTNLYYASIDGLSIGLTKAILGTKGSLPFGIPEPGHSSRMIEAPPLFAVLLVVVGLSALMIGIAWRRIQAVEVVR